MFENTFNTQIIYKIFLVIIAKTLFVRILIIVNIDLIALGIDISKSKI